MKITVSRVVMKNGGRTAVLRGIGHIGPVGFYRMVQNEMDQAVAAGSQVFYEGVADDGTAVFESKKERKIKKVVAQIATHEARPEKSLVLDTVVYPNSAIRADVSLAELVRELAREGFDPNPLLLLLEQPEETQGPFWWLMFLASGHDRRNGPKPNWIIVWLAKFISWLFSFRVLDSVLLNYRNEFAVREIAKQPNGDILVHYGEAHISGIRALMEAAGWTVEKIERFDFFDL